MGKLIRFDDAARDALRRGAQKLAGAVRVTLGPRGRNVVLERGGGVPAITNDGITIANEIELEDPFENMGAQLAKEAAQKTGETAGDGTTTATVLAEGIIARGLRAVTAGNRPMAVKRGIDRAVAAVVADIARQSRALGSREDVERIATVSARHDTSIGALIAEAMERVGRLGVITVAEGRGMDTTLDVVEGLRFDRGYLSPYFVTEPSEMRVTLENAYILLCDMKLSAANDLLPALEAAASAGRPLLVVAEDVEAEALATLVVNRLRGTLASVAVRAPGGPGRRREALEDLAVLTGARLHASDLGTTLENFEAADFGRARRVVVDSDTTTLTECGGNATEIRDRAARLRRERDESEMEHDRTWLDERIGMLVGGVAAIHVGAPTEIAMAERKARVEDALAATRAAVEEGVVVGGGVALIRARAALAALKGDRDERVGIGIVREVLELPAFQIAVNAGAEGAVVVARIREGAGAFGYDALVGTFGDLERLGVIDPAKVIRCALQHAASIGSIVLTTDAVVVEAPEEEGEGQGQEEE